MRSERGTALAETGLVVGLALTIVFNAIELALLGFYQLHADATAFASARYYASGGSTGTFPAANFPPALTPSITSSAGSVESTVTKAAAGTLFLIPGAGPVAVWGEAREPAAVTAAGAFPGFRISESLQQLVNYYASGTKQTAAPAVHAICLAHTVANTGKNGTNGAFQTWSDHSTTLERAYVELPSSWAAGALQATWQRNSPKYSQNQKTIDGWDKTATACSGT